MTFKVLLAALALITSTSAFALDATETLSDFKIDADVQETPSQFLITNAHLTYTSSTRGALSDPLRFSSEYPVVGATTVCSYFGAVKAVDYRGYTDSGLKRVLIVDMVKGKPAYKWSVADQTYLVKEVLCDK